MVYKTKEAILKHLPELNEEDFRRINEAFTPYLFYRNHDKEGYRECVCTVCGERFSYNYLQRTQGPEHAEFLQKGHNDLSRCPHCGKTVMLKEMGRAKKCTNLNEWRRIVLFKPINKTTVYAIGVYAQKDYFGADYLTKPYVSIGTVYYATPGNVRTFRLRYDYTYLGLNNNDFYELKTICEPFTKTYCYNWSNFEKRGYTVENLDRLNGTFMQYAVGKSMDVFDEEYPKWLNRRYCYGVSGETPLIKYIMLASLYPSLERLLKIGLSDFVCAFVSGKPMKRFIDWGADIPQKMFGMNKAEFREFREHYYGENDFKVYQVLRRAIKGCKYEAATKLCSEFGNEEALRIAQAVKKEGFSLTHTVNYLRKNTDNQEKWELGRTAILWTDYIRFAEQLKYDMKSGDVAFPKRLQDAHDKASAGVTALLDEKKMEQYRARYEKLQKMYEYTDGEYQIVVPLGIHDIVEEGKVLHHCVGGYADRHIKGATTILFLRKCEAPNTRLVTVEVRDRDKYICQIHGSKNRNPSKAEQAFINGWIAWVRAGSKHKKQKKAATAA